MRQLLAYSAGTHHSALYRLASDLGGAEEEVTGFTFSTTVKDGLAEIDNAVSFEEWNALGEGIPKNITYQKWFDVRDWVEFREGMSEGVSFEEWQANRSVQDTFKTAQEWLNPELWSDLGARYDKLVALDKAAEENDQATAGISEKDWMYFRSGIEGNVSTAGVSLSDAYNKQVSIRQESGLNKYVDIFTKIGFVLLGISFIIIVLNKPLKKLMHGVE